MIRSSGTGSGWPARNRRTRIARVAAGTWLMPERLRPGRPVGRRVHVRLVVVRAVVDVGVDRVGLAQHVLATRLLYVVVAPRLGGLLLDALGLGAGHLGAGLGGGSLVPRGADGAQVGVGLRADLGGAVAARLLAASGEHHGCGRDEQHDDDSDDDDDGSGHGPSSDSPGARTRPGRMQPLRTASAPRGWGPAGRRPAG